MYYTRRQLGKLALAGLPAAGWLFKSDHALAGVLAEKPNSKWNGVQVGMNVPYNFGEGNNMPADEVLRRCLTLGVSGVELRAQPVEMFLGAPFLTPNAPRAGGAARGRAAAADAATAPAAGAAPAGQAEAGATRGQGGRGGRGRAQLTPEQEAAQKAAAEEQRKWRLAAPMSKVKELRSKFEDAGVKIEIVKVDGIFGFADDVTDYFFELAKNLGARAISTEISVPDTKRLGQFADKHKMMVGYHGHTATGPAHWEEAFGYAKYNGANLDIGHFLGGQKTSPIPFLKQYHDRITHIHVKDKTLNDVNVPFGQGDTPIKEALQVIRDNKWNIQATIEFEYPVPAGSDRMTEMAKCMEYCKRCLLG
jgi:sugar phosphate isomerase/epimerase